MQLGVDEAGLGPTLGPLSIAGFATQGPKNLRKALSKAIGQPGCDPRLLEVGDSKQIHTGVRKLARIERTALATWMWLRRSERPPASALELIADVGPQPRAKFIAPWYRGLDFPLPVACDVQELCDMAARLQSVADRAGVEALAYRCDLISAAEYNADLGAEVDEGGTKNTWVVQRTLRIVRELVEAHATESVQVLCDKAGARDAYLGPLTRAFEHHAVDLVSEARRESHYRLYTLFERSPEIELCFAMKADSLDPRVSWASCLAKYLRELSMRAFNTWFHERNAELRPTAGYPQDARRFIDEAKGVAQGARLKRTSWIRGR